MRPVRKLAEPHILSACPACGARVRLLTRSTSGTASPRGESGRPLRRTTVPRACLTPGPLSPRGKSRRLVLCPLICRSACLGVRACVRACLPTLHAREILDLSGYGDWSRGEILTHTRPPRPRRGAERAAVAARGGAELGSGNAAESGVGAARGRLSSGLRPLSARGPREGPRPTSSGRGSERASANLRT